MGDKSDFSTGYSRGSHLTKSDFITVHGKGCNGNRKAGTTGRKINRCVGDTSYFRIVIGRVHPENWHTSAHFTSGSRFIEPKIMDAMKLHRILFIIFSKA